MFRAVHFSSHTFIFYLVIYRGVMLVADKAQARDCHRISESPSSQIVQIVQIVALVRKRLVQLAFSQSRPTTTVNF